MRDENDAEDRMKHALSHVAAASLVVAMLATPGVTQPADTALVNGKALHAAERHDDEKRGLLGPGYLADLAVLSKDYDSVGADEIAGIESLLTMVGGRIVYASGPFAALEDRPAN
jgi:Amidohydrolase family